MAEAQINEGRKNSGVYFQDAALFNSMNVEKNVSFPFSMHTDSTKEEMSS